MAASYLRLAAEQTPNAEGGAAKVSKVNFDIPVMTLKLDPAPTMLEVSDEMRGYTGQAPNKGVAEYAPSATFKTRVYPGILGALLLGATGSVVTTAGNGVITDPDGVAIPVGAYRHVFAWAAGSIPQTFQLNAAPPVGLFYKGSGLGIDSIDFSIDSGCWVADVATKQLYTAVIADPVINPAFETPMPFLSGMMTLSTWLAATALTKEFSFKIENTLLCERQFTTASLFPDSIVVDTPWQVLSGHIGKVAMDADDWAALLAGTTFAAKIKLLHTQVIDATATKHCMWIEMPACQYASGDIGEITNDRRHEASFDWKAAWDTVTSKWATITLVNGTALLTDY